MRAMAKRTPKSKAAVKSKPALKSKPELKSKAKSKAKPEAATAKTPAADPKAAGAKTPDAKPAKPTTTTSAVEMGARQREISVSEFFTKNRHLLGFDNPRKALLTCVKEAVDNALDACEDPGFLAGVEGVVDGFLHTREQRLSRIVESQEMSVLGEELGDGDLPLASPHLDGGHGRLRRRGGRLRSRRLSHTSHTNRVRGRDSRFPERGFRRRL